MNKHQEWYLGQAYTPWDRATRVPSLVLPKNSCDCAVHLYDSDDGSRLDPARKYDPPAYSSWEDMRRMHGIIGVDRAVLVQPTIYGTDHRLLLSVLRSEPDRYRGIAIINDDLTDTQLDVLHQAGVRSARFNLLSSLGTKWNPQQFQRNLDRTRELGWIVSLHATVPELFQLADFVRQIDQPVVLDHLAYFSHTDVDTQGHGLIKELIAQGNWWLKISRMDQVSVQGPPYADTIELIRRLAALDPKRVLWATDWPHVLYTGAMPNDGDIVELLREQIPDASHRHAALVDNPASLFGFEA
jgi:2-pyrone-4,6-dicarboxylate lactonase